MDHIRTLHLFVRCVELGNFTAAAREASTSQPTVSKALSALEQRMGVRLLERSTTSVVPTSQGMRFYERIKPMLEQYEEAIADAKGLRDEPEGLLRVNAPVVLGQLHVSRFVREFLDAHPGVEVELIFNDRTVNLVDEGVDVAVRLGPDLPPGAIGRRVGASERILVASPAYLSQHKAPRHPRDLADHQYVRFAWAPAELVLQANGQTETVTAPGRFRVNHALAIRDAVLEGAGVGLCPRWLVADELNSGALKRVLPRWSGQAQEIHLLAPSRRFRPARTTLFLDFLAARLAALPGVVSAR